MLRSFVRLMRVTVVALSLSLIGPGEPVISRAEAASSRLVKQQYVLMRTSQGPSSFTFVLGVAPTERGGFIGAIATRLDENRAKQTTPIAAFSFGRHDDPEVRVQEREFTGCNTAGFCQTVAQTFGGFLLIQMDDDGGRDALNRFYIVTEGRGKPDLELKDARGWKLEKTNLMYRYADGSDEAPVGAYVGSQGIEVFTEAKLVGGSGGSLAQATPPCSGSRTSVVFRGVGFGQLRGGKSEPATYCPHVGRPTIADHASGTTKWVFNGTFAGDVDLATTRLFVVDLPRPVR